MAAMTRDEGRAKLDAVIREITAGFNEQDELDGDEPLGIPTAWVVVVGGLRFKDGDALAGFSTLAATEQQPGYVTIGLLGAAKQATYEWAYGERGAK